MFLLQGELICEPTVFWIEMRIEKLENNLRNETDEAREPLEVPETGTINFISMLCQTASDAFAP